MSSQNLLRSPKFAYLLCYTDSRCRRAQQTWRRYAHTRIVHHYPSRLHLHGHNTKHIHSLKQSKTPSVWRPPLRPLRTLRHLITFHFHHTAQRSTRKRAFVQQLNFSTLWLCLCLCVAHKSTQNYHPNRNANQPTQSLTSL